jgi:pimeloyl-ACP methyl ester carboxylesterase
MSFSSNYFDYQGLKLYYSVYGKGEPVICLHGLNLDRRMFAGKKIKTFLGDKKLIALDLPGYGRSDFLPQADMSEISKVITALAREIGLSRFELCGFCLGGIFALDYAIRNQDKVTKLYLLETMIYLPWWIRICNTALFRAVYKLFNRDKFCLRLGALIPMLKDWAKISRRKLSSKVWNHQVNAFYLQMMKDYEKIDHLQRSRALQCETLLIFSANSFRQVRQTNNDLHASIEKSRLKMIKGKGHLSFI